MSSTAKLSMSAVLLSKSDHQAFAKLESTNENQIQPASATALTFFNQLVLAAWNMERTQRLEATLSLQSDPLLDLTHTPVLARIATCRLRAERTFYKCLKELRILSAKPFLQNEPNRLRYKLVYYDPPASTAPKIGPNSPCPCASGKQFKFCCLTTKNDPPKAT